MKYKNLKDNAFSFLCRKCINEKYGLDLESDDCYYQHYPYICTACGEVKNIVTDVSSAVKFKLWIRSLFTKRT